MSRQGFFITFEGGEGSGKTTQIQYLKEWLAVHVPSQDLVITREPGGVTAAELIRGLLVNGEADKWRPVTEAMLVSAARHEHVEDIIRPALEQNKIVISDRFVDSTHVYQGVVGGVANADIAAMTRIACGTIQPDLTIILDLDSQIGLSRAASRGVGEDRFETKGNAFHENVRNGFINLAKANPERCVLIDADRAAEQIADEIVAVVSQRLLSNGMAMDD